ncbi:MAG TPA: MFS transporter [Planctomycetaceae bacterium]|jgi:sugar phosphate permease
MESTTSPTRARFVVLGFLGSLTAVLYLDRLCIGQAEDAMRADLGFTKSQMGWVFTAFTIAYGLFEIPTGSWGDRYGSRGVLTRIVLWWSAFTALTGCIPAFHWGGALSLSVGSLDVAVPPLFSSLGLLILVRFLFGAGEAGALPNAARVVRRWFPQHERGRAQGIVLMAMQVGAVLSPVLASELIQAVGWRWSFILFGSVGLIWGGLFYRWYRDDPARHPRVNEAERELITAGGTAATGGEEHSPTPWRLVVLSKNVWLLGFIMSALSFASYMYMFWMKTYLKEARGLPDREASWLHMFALSGGMIGAYVGGFLSTWVVRQTGERRWSRCLLGCGCVTCCALFLGATMFCDSPYAACACFAAASFWSQAQISNWWAAVMDISGKHLGALFGLMNSMGIPGASISTIFLPGFVEHRGKLAFTGREQWDPAFYVYAGVLLFGALCWLFVDSTKSAVEETPTVAG